MGFTYKLADPELAIANIHLMADVAEIKLLRSVGRAIDEESVVDAVSRALTRVRQMFEVEDLDEGVDDPMVYNAAMHAPVACFALLLDGALSDISLFNTVTYSDAVGMMRYIALHGGINPSDLLDNMSSDLCIYAMTPAINISGSSRMFKSVCESACSTFAESGRSVANLNDIYRELIESKTI